MRFIIIKYLSVCNNLKQEVKCFLSKIKDNIDVNTLDLCSLLNIEFVPQACIFVKEKSDRIDNVLKKIKENEVVSNRITGKLQKNLVIMLKDFLNKKRSNVPKRQETF